MGCGQGLPSESGPLREKEETPGQADSTTWSRPVIPASPIRRSSNRPPKFFGGFWSSSGFGKMRAWPSRKSWKGGGGSWGVGRGNPGCLSQPTRTDAPRPRGLPQHQRLENVTASTQGHPGSEQVPSTHKPQSYQGCSHPVSCWGRWAGCHGPPQQNHTLHTRQTRLEKSQLERWVTWPGCLTSLTVSLLFLETETSPSFICEVNTIKPQHVVGDRKRPSL